MQLRAFARPLVRSLAASALAAALAVAAVGTPACTEDGGHARLYHSEPRAPSLTQAAIENLDHLGPTVVDKGVNFGVYSERATRIELLLFDDPEASRPTRQFLMTKFGNVWNVHVEGIGVGQHYGFVAWGPNWPYDPKWVPGTTTGFVSDVDAQGNRFNPNKLLFDPYGKALHRDHDWSKGSIATGPQRHVSTFAAASKSVVVESRYEWSANEAEWRRKRQDPNFENHRFEDLVLYEVHLKGFSADPASQEALKLVTGDGTKTVKHPGTYRGMGEMADYLADLGINAVELLPVHEKPLDGGYWGYMSNSFFAPELSYASRKGPREVLDEFKWMVDELHKRGIEVIVDVVYNHYGEGGLWRSKRELGTGELDDTIRLTNIDPEEVAGLYSFRGLDNAAYYALDPTGRNYWNNTGVGQQSRPNHRPVRRLIMDSLRFYAEELHVDGFRFDLAPVLGEKDGDYNSWDDPANTVLQDVVDDPVLQKYNTRIISEPWSLRGVYVSDFPASKTKPGYGWGEWNGAFRDIWRSFVNEDGTRLNTKTWERRGKPADVGFTMTGFKEWFAHNGRKPFHSVNFVTVHDGFTMYDMVTYTRKQNGCSVLNPACCDGERLSAWCDPTSGEDHNRSRDWGEGLDSLTGEATKRQMMRNFFVAMLVSHGTPMLYGGDEWMRTQLGNNNAYPSRADNEHNWFKWGEWVGKDDRVRMHDFVRKMVKFRHTHRYAFAPAEYEGSAPFAWKNNGNGDMSGGDWDSRRVMLHYYDREKGPELAILVNMERGQVTFKLPGNRTWKRVVDTQAHFDREQFLQEANKDFRRSANIELEEPTPVTNSEYDVAGSSIVILEAE